MSTFPSSSSSSTKPKPSTSTLTSTSSRSTPLRSHAAHHQGGGGGGTTTVGLTKLSNDQLAELEEAFQLFDSDHDNVLDYHEFKICLRALGFDKKKTEVVQLIREANHHHHPPSGNSSSFVSGNGLGEMRIGWEGFRDRVGQLIISRNPLDELKRAFRLFDEENKGTISLANLRKVAHDLGENLGDDELTAMIEEFDLDQDGEINEQEFMSIMADDV